MGSSMALTDPERRSDPGLRGVVAGQGGDGRARAWAERLGVPVCERAPEPPGVVLVPGSPPALQILGRGAPRPVPAALDDPELARRLHRATPKREDLARAVGLHKRRDRGVVDATAGLGRDGLVLAALGAQVTWLEVSPTLIALLEDGLERARNGLGGRTGPGTRQHGLEAAGEAGASVLRGAARRVTLWPGDVRETLPRLPADQREVVYLDPMYPGGSTRGAVGREGQALRELLGEPDPEAEAGLLAAARTHAMRRVVVKRPRRAGPLAGSPASRSVEGRAVRLDVYESG